MEKAAGSAAEALGRSLQLEARAVGLRGREDEKLGVCAGAQAVLASGFDGADSNTKKSVTLLSITPLNREYIIKSLEQLTLLGALADDRKLSDPVGWQMAALPLPPIYSKALIKSSELNCLEEMLIIVAMLSVESTFFAPSEKLEEARTARKRFESPEGDHLTLINLYRASDQFLKSRSGLSTGNHEQNFQKWCKEYFIDSCSLRRAREIHSQIRQSVEQMGLCVASCGDNMFQFRRCLAASFFLKVALKQSDGEYRVLTSDLANELVVRIHPSSVMSKKKPECIVFNELIETNDKRFICNTTRINYPWLSELAPPRLKKVWERHKLPWISNCR